MTNATAAPIVVGVDGSETAAIALNWAAAEASWRRSPLEVVHVAGPRHWVRRSAEQIKTITELYPSVHIRLIEATRAPARALVEASRGAAMLVVGSRDTSLVAQALLGSVSAYCASHARCPVVITPDREREMDFAGELRLAGVRD